MNAYRLYLFGGDGHIRHRIELEVEDDAQAIAAVDEHPWHARRELWQGPRLIKEFPPDPSPSAATV
jgi:hypothetical protein